MAIQVLVPLPELYDPQSGRLDGRRIAEYVAVPLTQVASALGKSYAAVHKTPAAPALQDGLRPIKRALDILSQLGADRATSLAWLNNPLPDLDGRAPLEVILEGHAGIVARMLEDVREGLPG